MMLPEAIGGCVLAGGLSRRMGQDKALLPYGGQRLVDHMMATLQAAGCTPVLVSGYCEGVPSLLDLYPRGGPMTGIASIMTSPEQKNIPAWLFVPVDMPLLAPCFLQRLLEKITTAEAVCFDDLPLPCLLYQTPSTEQALLKARTQLQASTSVSVVSFLSGLAVERLTLSAHEVSQLFNANTPQDWDDVRNRTVMENDHEFAL